MNTLIPTYSVLIPITAFFSLINYRFVRLQNTIAVMLASMSIAIALLLLQTVQSDFSIAATVVPIIQAIDFKTILLDGMLGLLLFAGALHVNFKILQQQRTIIATLAFFSTLTSTFVIAALSFVLLQLIGMPLRWADCLLFGALISPTDPIAVLATLKNIKAPARLHAIVAGESLFNDGVGIVIFLTLYHWTYESTPVHINDLLALFAQQSLGGLCYGVLLGYFAHWLIEQCDYDGLIAILVTLSAATGGYGLADWLNISGPLAMVASGLVIGNQSLLYRQKRQTLLTFWQLIDELLNAALFVLIGVEILLIHPSFRYLVILPSIIFITLLSRYITVAIPMQWFQLRRKAAKRDSWIIVWGGLRGGLAVALVMSLPNSPSRDLLLAMTYAVVSFTILVQGSTIATLLKYVTATLDHDAR